MRFFFSVLVGLAIGALAGALIGFLVQQVSGQQGWTLVVGSLGANVGAFWAGLRRVSGMPVWRVRSRS